MINVLFVCLGNICRSPSAESIFSAQVKAAGLDDRISCDSAGTYGYHQGEPADRRMQKHARRRGYSLDSISREFDPSTDFSFFDYIIGMDDDNIHALKTADHAGKYAHKIFRMTDFTKTDVYQSVPDPYYGGDQGFEIVLDILEDACEGLLARIKHELSGTASGR